MARSADATTPTVAALETLQSRLGHGFAQPELLSLALSHRSWCAENGGESNERLEFLGDAVLGMVVTDHIFTLHPMLSEGELAKVRASVVSAATLCEVAGELDIGSALRLGRGEETSGGRSKPSILADAMEAVLGAIYVDSGWEPARRVVLQLFGSRLTEAASEPGLRDYKTRLQELVARTGGPPPDYLVLEEGPDHAKSFQATVTVAGQVRGVGGGRSKKQAQQAAARQAWLAIIDSLAVESEPVANDYEAFAGPPGEESSPAADLEATDTSDTGGVDAGGVDTGGVDTGGVDTGGVDTADRTAGEEGPEPQ